jgi:hypothetical protein
VTNEEIQDLKRWRLGLLDEKQQLLARIARTEAQNKRSRPHNRPFDGLEMHRPNAQLYRELDREQQALHRFISEQKQQLASLERSDNAALCRELEEDAKIVFQEKLRLEDYRAELRRALAQDERVLELLQESDGPGVLPRQNETMRVLGAKLAKYKNANRKLKRRIRRLTAESSMAGRIDDGAVERRAQDLERQIADVKAATERNQAKFDDEKKRHEKRVACLKETAEGGED